MTAEQSLPPELRGPATTITRIAAGMSDAGVYRVEASGQLYVLKIAGAGEDHAEWVASLEIQRLAATAGLAPRVVHADEERRAVLTAFVADRSFPAYYRDPGTHGAALTQLGRAVRRLHALPVPAQAARRDPGAFLARVAEGLQADLALPVFAGGAIRRALAEAPAPGEDALVLGHNDLNPTNLAYDGESILMLDWATAGPMDPFYDLAVLAVFLRMDEPTCLSLLSAYEGEAIARVPERFVQTRRLAAALNGTMQLYVARQLKHAGATGAETLTSTLSLGDFYQRMQAGTLKIGTAEGQWAFGLALLKESLAV